jgi:integrase
MPAARHANTPDNAYPRRAPTKSELPRYMHRRGAVYYFKRKIPADAAHAFPNYKAQVWKSLGTDDYERAKLQLAVEVTQFDLAVSNVRARAAAGAAPSLKDPTTSDTSKYLLPAHIPAALARWDYDVTRTFDDLRRMFPAKVRQDFREAIATSIEQLQDAAAAGDVQSVEPMAQHILSHEKLIAPPGGAARQELLERLLQQGIQTMEHNHERARGKVVPLPAKAPVPARNLPTLLLLFEDWRKKQTRPRTINAVKKAVLEFQALHKALPVVAITRQHAREYRDHLIGKKLSDGTVVNRLGFLATLMRHGYQELIEDQANLPNPFESVKVSGGQHTRQPKERRPYSVAELNHVFSSKLYREGYRPRGQTSEAAYWAPLLGPFVGARIEEVAQLRIEDIERVNGVWSIRICDLGEDQKLKTSSSFRYVPMHEQLIKCGFLAYVARQKKAGHERVFPGLSNDNQNNVWSNALGKWWGRYLDAIGLSDPRLDYHSFRYTFKQRLGLSGVEDEVKDVLTGHWMTSAGRRYMRGEEQQYPFPKLASAMRQLRYDELMLGHLYVADPYEGVDDVLLKN